MAYLIIGMSFALIVGSLMWMLPSPNEKRLAALRANAAAAHFHLKFIKFENYLFLIPAAIKAQQKKPENQLLRYFWQGPSPIQNNRHFLFVFSEQKEVLSFRVNGLDANPAQKEQFQDKLQIAISAANYFQGLLALECKDEQGKRLISLYWPESGDIEEIDFKSQQIQALQARL